MVIRGCYIFCSTPKLQGHLLSVIWNCSFYIPNDNFSLAISNFKQKLYETVLDKIYENNPKKLLNIITENYEIKMNVFLLCSTHIPVLNIKKNYYNLRTGVWFLAGKDSSPCHNVQTRYGANPASYPIGIRLLSLEVKQPGCEANQPTSI